MTPTAGLETSYIAIGLVILLLIVCVPLYLSMRRHMRRIDLPTRAETMTHQRGGEAPTSAPSPR